MGTLMDKLNATNASKEQIRQAIERKKVSVPVDTPLKDYPAKIDGIYPDALFMRKDGKFGELTEAVDSWGPVMYANGYYLMLSAEYNNRVALRGTKETGWVRVKYPPINYIAPVYVLNNQFVIYYESKILASNDGETWSQISSTPAGVNFDYMFERNGEIVAIYAKYNSSYSCDTFVFYVSRDGCKTWSKDANYPDYSLERNFTVRKYLANINGRFFYISRSNDAETLVKSTVDFKTWTFCISDEYDSVGRTPYDNMQMITYGNGIYAGIRGNRCVYSEDGIDWKFAPTNAPGVANTDHIVFLNGSFVCGCTYSNDRRNSVDVSVDGKNWYSVVVDSKNYHEFNTLSVANGALFLTTKVDRKSYPDKKSAMFYGYDYYAWSKTLNISLEDTHGVDRLNEILSEFRPYKYELIQTATLQAAYKQGVNSI